MKAQYNIMRRLVASVRCSRGPLKKAPGDVPRSRLPNKDEDVLAAAEKLAATIWEPNELVTEPDELLCPGACCLMGFLRRRAAAFVCTNSALTWALPCTQAADTVEHDILDDVRGGSERNIVWLFAVLPLMYNCTRCEDPIA